MRRAAISSAPKPSSRSAASQRYRRSRTATPKRASSSRTSTQAIASVHWSSCRARPTSSPATRSSRIWRGRSRCRSPLWTRRTSRSSSARPTSATRRRRWASWSRRLRRRLERTSGCGASSDSSSANRTAKRPTNMPPMAIQTKPKYHRVLLKLSGEALLGGRQYGISPEYTRYVAEEIKKIQALGVQVAVVIGGGNIMRGAAVAEHGIEEATAHYMGMLAMVINALALQSQLESVGAQVRVQSAITIAEVAEPYIRRRAIHHLEKGYIVIFAAGTGNPFFTSDTAAALRAAEIDADVIRMGKNAVDGVYDADPRRVQGAKKYDDIRYRDLLEKRLGVMDATAAALAEERDIPIIVFDISQPDAMVRAAKGEQIGTLVHSR